MSVYVNNGTPLQSASLCETCTNAHIERGYRESEKLVFCLGTSPAHRVMFPVRECSSHAQKQRQTLWELQKMAWILDERPGRKVGFVPATELKQQPDEIEIILKKSLCPAQGEVEEAQQMGSPGQVPRKVSGT
jgi:hypothetical protein